MKPTGYEPIFRISPLMTGFLLVWVLVYALQVALPPIPQTFLVWGLSYVPNRWNMLGEFGAGGNGFAAVLLNGWCLLTMLSYSLLHGSLMHLVWNAVSGLAFGSIIEKTFGKEAVVGMFVVSAVAAAALHTLFALGSMTPIVGASGGISGWLGAFLMIRWVREDRLAALHAAKAVEAELKKQDGYALTDRALVLQPINWGKIAGYVALWCGIMAVFGLLISPPTVPTSLAATQTQPISIAWVAHIGGFLAGVVWAAVWFYRPTLSKGQK